MFKAPLLGAGRGAVSGLNFLGAGHPQVSDGPFSQLGLGIRGYILLTL